LAPQLDGRVGGLSMMTQKILLEQIKLKIKLIIKNLENKKNIYIY
jgi:hypothetical protein